MNKNLYYSHKDVSFDMVAFIKALIVGIIVSIPLSFAYDYAIIKSPSIWLCFLATAGFAVILGFVISKVLHWSKMRHIGGAMLLGFIVGLVALYVSWVLWIAIHGSEGIFPPLELLWELIGNPVYLWDIILQFSESGTRSIKSSDPVSGTMLRVIWVIEAISIVIGTVFLSAQSLDEPFSEEDDARFEKKNIDVEFAPFTIKDNKGVPTNEAIAELESGDLSRIVALADSDYEGSGKLEATIYYDQTRKTFYITLVDHLLTPKSDDLVEVPLVEYLSITPEQAKIFMENV